MNPRVRMKVSSKSKKPAFSNRFIAWLMVAAGVLGLIASFVLTIEKMYLLQNPGASLPCDLNPIVSCGSVMKTSQAMAFGFANSVIGLAAYASLTTIGVAMLAGAQFKRWFWRLVQAGVALGVLFVHWLAYQSIFQIGSLCPYCIVVWIATITAGWYITLYNLRNGHLKLPARLRQAVDFASKHHGDVLAVWLLLIAGVIIYRFWYYFGGLF